MLKRRILYFICLAVVFGVNIFYVEYQIFILLVLMIAIPLVSWIMYAISDVSLGLSLQVNKNVVQVGNRIKIRIVKKNACNLAFVNGSITIKYMYCHTGDEFMINVPILDFLERRNNLQELLKYLLCRRKQLTDIWKQTELMLIMMKRMRCM